MKSKQQQVENNESGIFVPSYQQISDTIGIPKTRFLRIRKQNQSKRDLSQLYRVMTTAMLYQQVLYFLKLWSQRVRLKLIKILRDKVHLFIENHPNVVQSPIMNDYISVKDKADPTIVHKVPKLLLQVSIWELHNDLIEQLPETSKEGIPLISDKKLREMIPPHVKKMTYRYKEMCGCTDCVSIGYFHSDNNAFISIFSTELKNKRDSYLPGSWSWTNANEKFTEFLDERKRQERTEDALNLLQCQPVDNAFPVFVHYSCAKGTCQSCPWIRPHWVLMRSNKLILFHVYKIVTTCTEHGVLSADSNRNCQHCE